MFINYANVQLLQSDFSQLDTWSKRWHLQFNAVKCVFMSLGKSQLLSKYTTTDKPGNEIDLLKSKNERDFGSTVV